MKLEIADASLPAPVSMAPSRLPQPAPNTSQAVLVGGRPHDPYFIQRVKVSTEIASLKRLDVMRHLCQGKRVLHVGCVDWPITNPANSLHVQLDSACQALDGFDIHPEAFDALRPLARGEFFSRWEQVDKEYDLVLVPEVMEHVPDVKGFLEQLNAVKAKSFVITVPDAFQTRDRHFQYESASSTFIEVVHPDHNCWYTPYTLKNVIEKYTDWVIDGMWFFNSISLLVGASKPQ